MKHCQFCAEEVQDAAVICKHCGKDLTSDASAKSHRAAWLVGFGLLVALAAVIQTFIGEASTAVALVRDQRELQEDLGRWHQDCDEFDLKTVRRSIDEDFRQTCIERKGSLDNRAAQLRRRASEPKTLPVRPLVEAWMR